MATSFLLPWDQVKRTKGFCGAIIKKPFFGISRVSIKREALTWWPLLLFFLLHRISSLTIILGWFGSDYSSSRTQRVDEWNGSIFPPLLDIGARPSPKGIWICQSSSLPALHLQKGPHSIGVCCITSYVLEGWYVYMIFQDVNSLQNVPTSLKRTYRWVRFKT